MKNWGQNLGSSSSQPEQSELQRPSIHILSTPEPSTPRDASADVCDPGSGCCGGVCEGYHTNTVEKV